MHFGQRWIRQPHTPWLRRALFQIHLWSGLSLGLYVVLISLSGAALVYRNELYQAFSPHPIIVVATESRLSQAEMAAAARRRYPDHSITQIIEGKQPEQAVEIQLTRGEKMRRRLFNPYTGDDLGDPLPVGFRITAWLLNFHDNLLAGESGRSINGVGAWAVVMLSVTGAIIWWPGVGHLRRSVLIDVRGNWKRVIWSVHSTLGFWFFLFIFMWGITGVYLCFPEAFADLAEVIEPSEKSRPGERITDSIMYWLAYLHFGRFGGATTKLVWVVIALVPPTMFVTGALMWWNRVLRSVWRKSKMN